MAFPPNLITSPLAYAGSAYVSKIDTNAVYLTFNLGSPIGAPNLVFTIQESDPLNPSVPLTGGQTASSGIITSAQTGILGLTGISSSSVLITWTLTGGSFGTAFATISRKIFRKFFVHVRYRHC